MSSSGVQQHANATKPESAETSEQNTSLQVQDQVSLIQTYVRLLLLYLVLCFCTRNAWSIILLNVFCLTLK